MMMVPAWKQRQNWASILQEQVNGYIIEAQDESDLNMLQMISPKMPVLTFDSRTFWIIYHYIEQHQLQPSFQTTFGVMYYYQCQQLFPDWMMAFLLSMIFFSVLLGQIGLHVFMKRRPDSLSVVIALCVVLKSITYSTQL